MSIKRVLEKELKGFSDTVSAMLDDFGEKKKGAQNEEVVAEVGEKWRWVARRVDMWCMGLYVAFLIIFHIALILALLIDL